MFPFQISHWCAHQHESTINKLSKEHQLIPLTSCGILISFWDVTMSTGVNRVCECVCGAHAVAAYEQQGEQHVQNEYMNPSLGLPPQQQNYSLLLICHYQFQSGPSTLPLPIIIIMCQYDQPFWGPFGHIFFGGPKTFAWFAFSDSAPLDA